VNDEGYITGITLKKTYSPASASPITQQTVTPTQPRSALKTAAPAIAIGCAAAICGVGMIAVRRKEGRS
ncbi:MAG: hypothetical protein IJL26_02380, partial [Clostridia bacterium]|nr:hypothetical protein [Clostridia bacterium]